jgi:Rrf2 family protein
VRVRLGRKGDYAVRAVLHLARNEGRGRCKTRQIAEDMSIPQNYLPQILAELVASGVVTSLAGRGGGYALARPASETRLLDVIEVVEGPVEVEFCVITGGPCRWEDECAVHRFWSAAQDAFRAELHDTTFADIAAVDAALAAAETPDASGT